MSRIKNKFIEDNAVDDRVLRLRNNLAMRIRNAANSADIDIMKLSNTDVFQLLVEMDMQSNKIVNMADPTAAQDAATKAYVDSTVSGLTDPKDAVRASTTAALPTSTYANGTGGVGATLTANANGALPSQDGVSLAVNERLLVKNQAAALENGIYVVTQLGDGSNPWILTRATDADNNGDADAHVTQGMYVPIAEGATLGTLGFILTSVSSGGDPQGDLVLGTDALNFAQFGEVIQAGFGLTKTGQTLAVDIGAGLEANGNQVQVNTDSDSATLVDGTTKIISGEVVGRRTFRESFTLTGTDISNGYIDLLKIASRDSIVLVPVGGPFQRPGTDFIPSYTGGTGGKTRVTFGGDLVSGSSALVTGDVLLVDYESLDY